MSSASCRSQCDVSRHVCGRESVIFCLRLIWRRGSSTPRHARSHAGGGGGGGGRGSWRNNKCRVLSLLRFEAQTETGTGSTLDFFTHSSLSSCTKTKTFSFHCPTTCPRLIGRHCQVVPHMLSSCTHWKETRRTRRTNLGTATPE